MNKLKSQAMLYEPFQYYTDELAQWNRVIEFEKWEAGELVRRMTIGLKQATALTKETENNNFTDQFLLQEQKCDHLMNQITSQRTRLERSAPFPGTTLEGSIVQEQDVLRSRMHANEKNFIRAKYAAELFLSEFLLEQVVQRSNDLKKAAKFKYDTLAV